MDHEVRDRVRTYGAVRELSYQMRLRIERLLDLRDIHSLKRSFYLVCSIEQALKMAYDSDSFFPSALMKKVKDRLVSEIGAMVFLGDRESLRRSIIADKHALLRRRSDAGEIALEMLVLFQMYLDRAWPEFFAQPVVDLKNSDSARLCAIIDRCHIPAWAET